MGSNVPPPSPMPLGGAGVNLAEAHPTVTLRARADKAFSSALTAQKVNWMIIEANPTTRQMGRLRPKRWLTSNGCGFAGHIPWAPAIAGRGVTTTSIALKTAHDGSPKGEGFEPRARVGCRAAFLYCALHDPWVWLDAREVASRIAAAVTFE